MSVGVSRWCCSDGTDGRRMIRKTTSVTGRHDWPVIFALKGTSLLYLWIGVGIFYPQSDSTGDIKEANISTDKDEFGYLISERVFT